MSIFLYKNKYPNLPSDEELWGVGVAEIISKIMNANHGEQLLDDDKVLELGLKICSYQSRYHEDFHPLLGEIDKGEPDFTSELKAIKKLSKIAEALSKFAFSDNALLRKIVSDNFETGTQEVPGGEFFGEDNSYWPLTPSRWQNAEFDAWLQKAKSFKEAVETSARFLEHTIGPPAPTSLPGSLVEFKGRIAKELFYDMYPTAKKGGSRGGRGRKGPLYTFIIELCARSFRHTTSSDAIHTAITQMDKPRYLK